MPNQINIIEPMWALDLMALAYFVLMWVGYSNYAQKHYSTRPNLMFIMDQMRAQWMRSILRRPNRIADANLVGNLLRSISFLANTSIFILIGLITVLGYRESAIDMLNTIPFTVQSEPLMWEVKVFTLILIFVYAFFKFTWSLRQYNYCTILVGAAPMPDETPELHDDFGLKAGAVIQNAGKHFNMGMRAYYFGMAALSWFLHPLLFILLTTLIIAVTYRREFRSHTLVNLSRKD